MEAGAQVQGAEVQPLPSLRPFPGDALRRAAKGARKIIVAESAINQLARFVRDELYGHASAPIVEHFRPSMGITPKELVDLVTSHA